MRKISKEELNQLQPTVWIGKKDITPTLIAEIKLQLKKKGYLKVKIHKTIKDKAESITSQILAQTNAKLMDKRGMTLILKKAK